MPTYLVFDACSVSPTSLEAGQQFTSNVTLRNPSFSDVIYDVALHIANQNGDVIGSEWVARDENLGNGSHRDYTHTTTAPAGDGEYNVLVQVPNESQSGGGFAPAREPAPEPRGDAHRIRDRRDAFSGCGGCGSR